MMASDPDLVIALLTGLAAWSLRAIALGGLVALMGANVRHTGQSFRARHPFDESKAGSKDPPYD
jgi:hypothetical protein